MDNFLLFRPLIFDLTFTIHDGLTLTVFLLMILLKGWLFGKQFSLRVKKSLPIFVTTLLQKGGLYQVIFLDLDDFLVLLAWGWYSRV